MKSVSLRLSGRVQGVWFRAETKRKADALNICGNVRNLPNGEVYIEATGPDVQMDLFIGWCSKGPKLARVDQIKMENIKLEATAFRIIG